MAFQLFLAHNGPMRLKQAKLRGNAFLIALVSVVLLGTLTVIVTRQMSGSALQNISTEKADLYAGRAIAHAEEMKAVLYQMDMLNVDASALDFEKPSSGTFNSGTTSLKVFHPAGGGLKESPVPPSDFYKTGYSGVTDWQFQKGTNVEWTPTSSTDVIYSIWGMSDAICSAINKKITGTTTIPTTSTAFSSLFQFGSTDVAFTATDCAACSGYPLLCIQNSGTNAFYSIVLAR